MKPGYLYVLVHPSEPNLYKIGQTTRHPEQQLAQHNSNYNAYAGKVVKETGLKWELKTHIAVPDPHWAKAVFWSAIGLADIPYRGRIDIERIDWKQVLAGLDAAKKAGIRPQRKTPEYVYAYTAWMKKRLEGRGIALEGYVRSKFGKSNFRCVNGHEWRAVPIDVAEGAGCPQCGTGTKTSAEMREAAKAGTLCLLIRPDEPGLVRIGLTHEPLEQCEGLWNGWEVHRFRNVDQADMAESLIWRLLDRPRPREGESIRIDLEVAEQAFRDLIPQMQRELASESVSTTAPEPKKPRAKKNG